MKKNNVFLFKSISHYDNVISTRVGIILQTGLRSNPFLISIIVNTFLYSIFLLCTIPVFRSNDDILLNLISAGFFGKESSEYIVFFNILFGKLLKFLYSNYPDLNWYIVFQIFVQFFSHVIILAYLLRIKRTYFTLSAYLCLFLLFSTNFLLELNFSSTSLIALSSSFVVLLFILSNSSKTWSDYLLFIIFFTLCFLVRKASFFIFCYFFVFLLMLYIRKWKILISLLSLTVLIFISLNLFSIKSFSRKDPLQTEYQKSRSSIQDLVIIPSEAELKTNNWDKEDYKFYSSFKSIDNDFFNKLSVINLSKNSKYKPDFKKIILSPYSLMLGFIADIYYYVISFSFFFILYCFMRKTFKYYFIILLFTVLLFFLLGIILFHYRTYIYYPLLFFVCAAGIFYIINPKNKGALQKRISTSINSIILLLFVLISLNLSNIIHQNNLIRKLQFPDYENKVRELTDSNEKYLVIGKESEYFFGKWSIFKTVKNNSENRLEERIIPLGWFINTIQFDGIVNGSVIKKLLNGDIYFLGKDEELYNNLKKFVFKHYNLKIDFIELDNYKYSPVYKLITSFPN